MGRRLSTTRPRGLRVREVPITHPDAQVLIDAVQQEYITRYGGPDATPMRAEEFEPPSGRFLVGHVDGVLAVCGGVRRVDAETAEIKRMYVRPEARRLGYARTMLALLERAARDAGYRRLVLESGNAQPEALALYSSSGYTPVTPYGFYRCHAEANSLGKSLDD